MQHLVSTLFILEFLLILFSLTQNLFYKGVNFKVGLSFALLFFVFIPIWIMIFSGIILLSESDFYYTTINDVVFKTNIETSFVLLSFIFSIIIYLYIPLKKHNKTPVPDIFKPSISYYLIIYVIGMLIVFIGSGLLEGGNWYQNRHHFFDSNGAIAVLIAFIINSAKILVIASIVHKWVKGEWKFFKFLAFVVSFSLIDMVFSGNRIYLFCTAIIIGLLLLKKYPKKTIISLPFIIPSAFILGYFASIFRHMRGPLFAEGLPTWSVFQAALKRAMMLEPPDFTSFFLGISESVNVNVMYDLFGRYNDFLYGATYLKPFVFYLPRSIWEGKPQSITVLTAEFLGGASLVTTVIGEMYMNFYLFGIIILPIFLWYTDVLLTNTLKSYGTMSNVVMFFFGILIFRMPFSDELLVFAFLVLILRVFYYFKKYKFVIK
tara:strand:- start:1393 stop:2691 length:1299 start_codon:yes stop_codon:yes gene_type:complete